MSSWAKWLESEQTDDSDIVGDQKVGCNRVRISKSLFKAMKFIPICDPDIGGVGDNSIIE